MSEPRIPVARPALDEREVEAARRAILSGWVTQGPEVGAFEHEFADYVGAPYACAVSSCTAALHLALLAAGVGPGDEVVTVSHSFVATANAVRYCGATPVFVDVQPDTFNMDPCKIEAALTDRTRAILCVHQVGMPADLRRIVSLARAVSLPVVEDAACAIGSEIRCGDTWERIGKPHGDVACFSFHPRKVITTGDGGMITTANPEWDQRFRVLRHQGMSTSDVVRHRSNEVIFESYPEVGFNYRLTDIQAAIGRSQLCRLPDLVKERRVLAANYSWLLQDIPGLGVPVEPEWARSNWQSYVVRLPSGCDQRQVMQQLLDKGVSTRRGVMCSHREAPYNTGVLLPASEAAQDETIVLPLYPGMTDAEQDHVVNELRRACTPN